MARYLVGLDSGTTGIRSKIYDLEGNVMAQGYREYGCVFYKPGWIEQDINMMVDAMFDSLAEVVAKGRKAGVDPKEIASIGLSTQRILHMYVDRAGRVMRNGLGISWQDSRCGEEAEWMRGFGDEYTQITGLPVGTAWGSGKVKWVQNHEPETYERAAKILTTQEYFLHQLGAKDGWFQDWSNASYFGLLDVEKMEFSDVLLKRFGIGRDKLPDLVGSGWQVGTLDKYASERTGLPVDMPVCTGGGDQQCAGIGSGVIREGLCEVTFGTSGVSLAALNTPKHDPNKKVSLSAAAFPEKAWESEGLQMAAASSYRWFRDTIGQVCKMIEPITRISPYQLLDRHAEQAPVGSNGVLFQPYLAGSNCPNYDGTARGAFLGLSFKSDVASMARAVLEGVALEARSVLEAFYSFIDIKEIILSDGATHSKLWCQIQADVYNRPATMLREGECTVLGAAILGGVGAGVFGSVQEGVDRMVKKVSTYEPNPENVPKYDELYGLFQNAYGSLAGGGFYKKLNRFTENG